MDLTEQKLQENLNQQVQKEENITGENISGQLQYDQQQNAENISAQNKEMNQNLKDFLTEEEEVEAQPLTKQQKHQQYLESGKLKEIAVQSNNYHKKSTREKKYKNFMNKQKKLAKMKDDFKTSEKKAEEITGLTPEQKDSYYQKRFEKELEMLDIKLDAKLEKAKAMAMNKSDEKWRQDYEKMKINDAKIALFQKYISSGNLTEGKAKSLNKALATLKGEEAKFKDVRALANYKQELAPKNMLSDKKLMDDSVADFNLRRFAEDSYDQVSMNLATKYGYSYQVKELQWQKKNNEPISDTTTNVLNAFSTYLQEAKELSGDLVDFAGNRVSEESFEHLSGLSKDVKEKIALAKRAPLTMSDKLMFKSIEHQLESGELQGYHKQSYSRFKVHSLISKATTEDAKEPIKMDLYTTNILNDAQIERVAKEGTPKEKLELYHEKMKLSVTLMEYVNRFFYTGNFDVDGRSFVKLLPEEQAGELEKNLHELKAEKLLQENVFHSVEEENEFFKIFQEDRIKVAYATTEKLKKEFGLPKENEDQLEEKDRSPLRRINDSMKLFGKLNKCKTDIMHDKKKNRSEALKKNEEKLKGLQKQLDDKRTEMEPICNKMVDFFMSPEYENLLIFRRMHNDRIPLCSFLNTIPDIDGSELNEMEESIGKLVDLDDTLYTKCVMEYASEEKKQQYQKFLMGKMKEMQINDATIEELQKHEVKTA